MSFGSTSCVQRNIALNKSIKADSVPLVSNSVNDFPPNSAHICQQSFKESTYYKGF
jgi:hypothetical protein